MADIDGVPALGWNEANPPDTEKVALGASRMRSIKTSVRYGLSAEHNFPTSGDTGGFGYHIYGSARPYYGTQSRVSSSGTDGRIMQASDTSNLFAVGSGGTAFLGGPTVPSFGSVPWTLPQRHYWAEEFGASITTLGVGIAADIIFFPNSGFSGVPQMMLQAYGSNATNIRMSVETTAMTSTATRVRVTSYDVTAGAYAAVNYFWRSAGTRVL